MSPLQARLCIVASAAIHALWNALVRRQTKAQAGGQVAAAVLLTASISTALVWAMGPAQARLTPTALAWAALAGVGEAGYFFTLGPALASLPLGQAYAYIRGGGMLAVWSLSTLFLAEPMTLLGTGGSALLLLGLVWPSAGACAELRLPPVQVLLCAAAVTTYHLAYGQGLAAGAQVLPLFGASMLVALPLLACALGTAGMADARRSLQAAPAVLSVAGMLSTLAFVLFLASLRHLDAGAGFALRNTSIVFAQLLGWAGGERVSSASVVRTALMFAGACGVAAA